MASDLGEVYRSILSACCAPIFWYRPTGPILHNGTLTFVQTPKRLLGITAAHVLRQYELDHGDAPVRLQVMNALWETPEIIAISDTRDLATIAVPQIMLSKIGKELAPLSSWPPIIPQEDRGIMLAGYPGVDRVQPNPFEVNWGLFTALGIARRVVGPQITWRVDRDWGTGDLPANHNLGGISGGPLIGWFESPGYLTQYRLSGIVTEASSQLENGVATRADFMALFDDDVEGHKSAAS